MNTQKPFNWSNVIMIAVLVVVVLIPLVMSQSGKRVDSWTRATDMGKTLKSLEAMRSLEAMEALEGLPEFQAELDSILEAIEIPDMDSFMFVVPELPYREDGESRMKISISKSAGFPSFIVPPEIVGGYDALLEHLVYPEKLKEDGVEGTVIVQLHVEKDGSVGKSLVLNSSGYELFDNAALEAVTKIRFEPVHRDDEPLDVWLALPVFFKLKR